MTKLFALVSLAAGALSISAQAQEVAVSVGYGDLNLASEAGVVRLDHRIRNAVEQVCGIPREQKALSSMRSARKCGREAWAKVAAPRQIAIARARGQAPSVELAGAGSPGMLTVRRR